MTADVGDRDKKMAANEVGDIVSLLSTYERNFLIRNNGDKVAIGSLEGKMIALYFSSSRSPRCKRFTLTLIEVYNELTSQDNNFEIIFLPYDCCERCNSCECCYSCEKSFNEYFSKIPWFTIPISDNKIKEKLHELFKVSRRPTLVILDANGKVLNREGVQAVRGYGAEAYPFTVEKISKLRVEAENAKKDQTLRSILVSSSRDYLIANDRSKVSVSKLEGKIVALYFSCINTYHCEFTSVLAQIYGKLKEIGEGFEVVLVSLEDNESYYDEAIKNMPWLAFPFNDKSCDKLFCYFGLQEYKCDKLFCYYGLQGYKCYTVILIGSDGKTMNVDLIELIKEYEFEAWEAFPFSQEKLHELSEKEKAKLESQTLKSLLVSGDLDYVIGKNGLKVPLKELVGKTILLQFSACADFISKLIKEYPKIKNVDPDFEVIYIPVEDDRVFDRFFTSVPWLALPLYDERVEFLRRRLKIRNIPSLVAIGPTGRTINKEVEKLLMIHGADAYPFTEEKLKELEHQNKEMPERWPKKIVYHTHKHELLLIRCCSPYRCGVCEESGHSWSYCCIKCDFDLHPKCALW